ncbi:Lipase (class 2) [Parelaphostrongylus tenuis]|uniref:Lipase (Class 2) n=1 Tax=Parelaphostrongylus tenuis TaxID=148309 RepID=A0AAD5NAI0_PARTN|nr:Lipase (class 2) [Parelaphostrongylus tenuis]
MRDKLENPDARKTTRSAVFTEQPIQLQLSTGWKDSEVYGTTYGDGGRTIAPLVDMKCDYVKQVRWMIQAVSAFTRRRVDVIGYSMGSPISRKAILGGRCVDTREELGPSLTALVDTFVSVAGANRGSFLCLLPFPGACNNVNGLSCTSEFIKDINSRQRYEGLYIYSIYSPQDDKVGYRNACGQLTSAIAGANQEFEVSEVIRIRLYSHSAGVHSFNIHFPSPCGSKLFSHTANRRLAHAIDGAEFSSHSFSIQIFNVRRHSDIKLAGNTMDLMRSPKSITVSESCSCTTKAGNNVQENF